MGAVFELACVVGVGAVGADAVGECVVGASCSPVLLFSNVRGRIL